MAAVANRLMQNIRLNAKSFLQERRYTTVQSPLCDDPSTPHSGTSAVFAVKYIFGFRACCS